jgi:sugar phosphate isomerase/epimerase
MSISLSVITSAMAEQRLSEFFCELPSYVEAVELYIFRDYDIHKLTEGRQNSFVLDILSGNQRQVIADNFIKAVEAAQDERLRFRSSSNLKIVSLATYLPQISDEQYNESMKKALLILIYIAKKLDCHIIELVCGTVMKRKELGKLEFIKEDYSDKLKQIIKLLCDRTVVSQAKRNKVFFALEFEYGVFNVLNGIAAINKLFELIREKRVKHIGLNLDIGHAIMINNKDRNFSPDFFREHGYDYYIMHSHISDNANGHYADLPPGYFHNAKPIGGKYSDWINLVKSVDTLFNNEREDGFFSHSISLELEAAHSVHWLHHGCRTVYYLINQYHR